MDLQQFISVLKRHHEIEQVDNTDPNLEIGTITELADERNGPALLFDNIKGYPAGQRIVTGAIATPRRWALAFGLQQEIPTIELVRFIKDKLTGLKMIAPVAAKSGAVLDNVDEGDKVDLTKFPAPVWHEHDGGRYLGTGDLVIVRDPEGGWVNAGTYRAQLHDRNTLGLYATPGCHADIIRKKYWARGKACPMVVVLGSHPLVLLPSCTAFPWQTEELAVAGGLMGQPLKVINGEVTGLPIPASSEIAIEGECPPLEVESRTEGPFGEFHGYYYGSGTHKDAVVKVKRVLYRNNPVNFGSPPLRPPASGTGTFILRAAILWKDMETLGIPGIKGVFQLRAGGSRALSVISLQQKYAGHAQQVALAAVAAPGGAFFGRFTIVVDEDIDPSNEEDVLWAISTRCDPATSIQVMTGCFSTPSDTMIPPERREKGDTTNSRAMINACRPYHWRDKFPLVNRASDDLRSKTLSKWKGLFNRRDPGEQS